MRDALFLALIVLATGFAMWRPLYAAMAYAWVSLMVPHTLVYGFAATIPWAFYFATLLAISLIISREPWARGNWGGYVPALLFFFWTTVTLLNAMAPDAAYARWVVMLKIQIAMILTLLVMSDRESISKMVWIIALSLGFYGLKGAIFTVVWGGQYGVTGPPGSFIEDNNALAVALLATIPLLVWLREESEILLVRMSLAVLILLTGLSALATYSRGALVAATVGGAVLLIRARRRIPITIGLVVVASLLIYWMPDQYWERMTTIFADERDASSEGRLAAWSLAVEVANDWFTGGGFDYYQAPDLPVAYVHPWGIPRAAHSIYFQVLGDHGWVGLGFYLMMISWFFWALHRIRTLSRHSDHCQWALGLSGYLQVSLVVILTGGAFLSLAYWEFIYYLCALVSTLLTLVKSTIPIETQLNYQEREKAEFIKHPPRSG